MHRIRMAVRENVLGDPGRIQPSNYAAILDAGGRGWVAEVEGRMVGFAVADLARSNVWALFVDPGFEARGVGRRLHDTMMDWFFAAGADRVWLGTDPGTRAEGFYRSAGWSYVGDDPNGEARYEMSREEWLARAPRRHESPSRTEGS
ncbi:MAG: GNAT family N-acetyltransferase [Gemmatimonadetes bacterium]|nr:GNAT family N-acetyltransferase [Gemmatimonadota bacterium]